MLRSRGKEADEAAADDGNAVEVLLEGGKSFASEALQWNVMTFQNGRGGGRYLYNKAIRRVGSGKDVLEGVRKHRHAWGIVQWREGMDFTGLRVVKVSAGKDAEAVEPALEPVMQSSYPLTEELVMYVRKDAGDEALAFRDFVLSKSGAAVLSEFGLVTPDDQWRRLSTRRLEAMERGEGPSVVLLSDSGVSRSADGLVESYVRSSELIRARLRAARRDTVALGAFVRAGAAGELLLLEGRPDEMAMRVHGERWSALGPAEHLIGGRAVGIIVNRTNGADSLTVGQIRSIFRGQLDDWRVVGDTGLKARGGGRSVRIHPIRIGSASPATKLFAESCLPPDEMAQTVELVKDTEAAVKAVSRNPQAIAFVDLAKLPKEGQTVKTLAIRVGPGDDAEDVKPVLSNIKNAMYPLSKRVYLYVHPEASEAAKGFAEYLATGGESVTKPWHDAVAALGESLRKHGILPLSEAAIRREAKARLERQRAARELLKSGGGPDD